MLLELKNVKKYFKAKNTGFWGRRHIVKAVDNVSFSLSKGESVGLVGESGCGKTTLARILMGLYTMDAGEVSFEGKTVRYKAKNRMRTFRKKVQMIFQDPYNSLDPRFTVRQILNESLRFMRMGRILREEKIEETLKAVGMPTDILNHYPHEFSGGERQRIAIARALIMEPELLVLDEATSALDVLVQQQIVNLLRDLQEKFDLAYLFISHNLRVVKKVSANIAVMYQGKIVEKGTSEEIFKNPLHPYTRKLLQAAINYHVENIDADFSLNDKSHLVDRGNGHFVIE